MATHHVHDDHPHRHGSACGHESVEHEGHVDYLHDDHAHHEHGDHYDEHAGGPGWPAALTSALADELAEEPPSPS